jgi:hypothetical protein
MQAMSYLKKALENVMIHFPKDSPHKTRIQDKIKFLNLDQYVMETFEKKDAIDD